MTRAEVRARHTTWRARFASAALSVAVLGAGGTDLQVSADDALADLDAVADLVRTVHPAPFRYVTPTDFEAAHMAARGDLLGAPAIDDIVVGRAIQQLLSRVGDAHFAVALPSFQPGVRTEPFLLPLLPKRAGGRVYVDASIPEFPVGTELLEIDGTPIDDLWNELSRLALVDGDRASARAARVERDFTLHFHIGRGTRNSYAARVRPPGGAEQSVELPAATREALGSLRQARHSAAPGGLRTNGVAALNHIIPGPYSQWTSMAVRIREIPEFLRPQISFPFTAPDTLSNFPGAEHEGGWRFEGDPLAGAMTGARDPFAAPLAILIDDATNSAANEMIAALLAARPDTRLIGTETIGECGRHIGEVPVMFTGRTGFRVLMSTVAIEHVPTRRCGAGRGFAPDTPIEYSAEDFVTGRDPYRAAIEAWLHTLERGRRP